MMRRKEGRQVGNEAYRFVGAKVTATQVNNSEHRINRINNQTYTLKETSKKGDVSLKKGGRN
jgi:hypothetical protein